MDFIHSDDIIHHANGNIYIKKKCKYCTFKTAWDTEMIKHEKKIHNIGVDPISTMPKKIPRPIPNLIPIQHSPPNDSNAHGNETDKTSVMNLSDIKELSARAGFSSLHDFISLFGDDESESKNSTENNLDNSKTDSSNLNSTSSNNNSSVMESIPNVNTELKRKHTSFFDKLKAKLMTNAGETCNLTCKWCGHESKCLSEVACHQKICGKEPSNNTLQPKAFNVSSTRCQFCRQRCKSSIDLLNHLQVCPSTSQNQNLISEDTKDTKSETSETHKDDIVVDDIQEPHPMENVVFVWNNINQMEPEILPQEKIEEIKPELTIRIPTPENEIIDSPPINQNSKMPTHGTDLDQVSEGKRVFKCPHCTFWASTASRFHVHIVGHLNKKPFECSLCAYRSNWRWDITKHIRLKSVRDSAHQKAKVLMTDETGRRNYSKYNKYLTQMKASKSQDKKDKPETQGQMTPDQILPPIPQLIQAPAGLEIKSQTPVNLLRPPPPLKPAYITYYHNTQEHGKKKSEADIKKTLFKCKKCNFR